MKTKTVLRTLHGSHLYGLSRPDSDYDYYEIYDFLNQRYRPKKQAKQRIDDDLDEVRVSLDKFTDICFKGVPQAVEVLFSPPEAWVVENGWLDISAKIKLELRKHMPAVLETYRRTALSFFYSRKDQIKKRRHAFRLLLNANELKVSGEMHSRLIGEQFEFINWLVTSFYSEEKFKDMVFSTFELGKHGK
jgi:predicted nucleotidyltransferase